MDTPIQHIAIMMDGNRRWAKSKGLDPVKGHEFAANQAIEPIIDKCVDLGIPFVTFWAFSTENWKRDEDEIKKLFELFRIAFGTLAVKFIKKGARLRILGELNRFPKDIANRSLEIINQSAKNSKITVSFALNYGGRDEILRAVKKIVKDKVDPKDIDETLFSSYLDTSGIPDPDLIIRTGGEFRTSGYLPWQAVYAELYFTSVLFPDFTPQEFEKAITNFSDRDRRFGGNSPKNPK